MHKERWLSDMEHAQMEIRDVARASIMLAMTATREEEAAMKAELLKKGVRGAAVDYGGEYVSSVMRMIERTVIAAKREGLISDAHHEEGAVAGAAHEAISQVAGKAMGLNVGGKIGMARSGGHIAVTVFFGIGLVHLNEVCLGLGHRSV